MSVISNKKLPVVEEIRPEVIIKVVKIESLVDGHLQYEGRSSGKLYEWKKSGDTVLVQEEDVAEMLSRTRGKKTCCGNGDNRIFQIAL